MREDLGPLLRAWTLSQRSLPCEEMACPCSEECIAAKMLTETRRAAKLASTPNSSSSAPVPHQGMTDPQSLCDTPALALWVSIGGLSKIGKEP